MTQLPQVPGQITNDPTKIRSTAQELLFFVLLPWEEQACLIDGGQRGAGRPLGPTPSLPVDGFALFPSGTSSDATSSLTLPNFQSKVIFWFSDEAPCLCVAHSSLSESPFYPRGLRALEEPRLCFIPLLSPLQGPKGHRWSVICLND